MNNPYLLLPDNILMKLDIKGEDDCWLWTGAKIKRGYGTVNKNDRIHRVVWKILYGAIPDGLFVLHKCDTRLCANPQTPIPGNKSR